MLLHLKIVDKQPAVVFLDVQLENQHTVYLREKQQQQTANRLGLALKSPNGLLPVSSGPALQSSVTLTSHTFSHGTKAASAENQKQNLN